MGLNMRTVEPGTWQGRVKTLLADCPPVSGFVACLAGLLTPEDAERAKQVLTSVTSCPGYAVPDFCALEPLAPQADLHVIAGTGSILVSFRPYGGYDKSGGGGPLIGDVGSGFALGRAWLSENLLPAIRYAPADELTEFWRSEFGSDDPQRVLAAIYSHAAPPRVIARHAEFLIRAAERDDPIACCILEEQMERLADLAWLHLRVHTSEKDVIQVALAGGLWKSGDVVQNAFRLALQASQHAPQNVEVNLVVPTKPPVWGAALLAKKRYL